MISRFKKFIAMTLVFTMTMITAGCANSTKKDVIEEVTTENVDQIVAEYKDLLGYFQNLKNELENLASVRDGKESAESVDVIKENLKSNSQSLQDILIKFKDLTDAKQLLLKAYSIVEDSADNVVKDKDKFDKNMEEYKAVFTEFNGLMTKARGKIEAVRGKSSNDKDDLDKQDSSLDENNDLKDKKDGSDKEDKKDDKNKDNKDSKKDESKNNQNTQNSNQNDSQSSANQQNPDVVNKDGSKLDDSLKKDIYNAGFNSGKEYKASGSGGNIDAVAADMFDGLEGDSPIEKDKIPEAKRIFMNAFRSGYNS